MEPHERIIVALDVPTWQEADTAARELSGLVGGFKVGLQLLTAEGPTIVEFIRERGRVLYDGKFHDISNTMAGAARAVAALGVWGFTVHASAGRAGIEAAVRERGESLVLAVTVLTSLSVDDCRMLYGAQPADAVVALANLARSCAVDGVVCSPLELRWLRQIPGLSSLLTVVPGVRPIWAYADDQARAMTPAEAIRAGADHLVIGRPILRPPPGIGGRADAARRIADEIGEALT